MKKAQVAIFVIIALILMASVGLIFVFVNKKPEVKIECNTNDDCVPATCCHPDSCVPRGAEPDCYGAVCTLVCEPGTLDCGQGDCACVNSKCKAVI